MNSSGGRTGGRSTAPKERNERTNGRAAERTKTSKKRKKERRRTADDTADSSSTRRSRAQNAESKSGLEFRTQRPKPRRIGGACDAARSTPCMRGVNQRDVLTRRKCTRSPLLIRLFYRNKSMRSFSQQQTIRNAIVSSFFSVQSLQTAPIDEVVGGEVADTRVSIVVKGAKARLAHVRRIGGHSIAFRDHVAANSCD